MYKIEELKKKLEQFRDNKNIIEELSTKYSITEILSTATKNNMDDVIINLFQPIEINGEYKQFFDYYSVMDTYPIDYEVKEYLEKMEAEIDIDNPNTRNIKLKNSLAREVSGWGHPIRKEKDVRYYAEPACLESMLYFFRNNITTTMNDTECVNNEGKEGICKVWIRYDILSDENKKTVEELIEEGNANFVENEATKTISIFVPCKEDETIGTISDRLMNLTKKFKKQVSYKGLMTNDTVMNILAASVKKYLYNGETLPEKEERYIDLFYKYIDEGLLKPLELSDFQKMERSFELVQSEEGLFSTTDFLNVIKELEPQIIEDLIIKIPYYSIYCDENGRYWESKECYDNYLEEKKQIEKDKMQTK